MSEITYQDIENTVAECGNMGGINDQVYFAPRSHFKTLADKPSCEGDREFDGMNMLSVGVDELLPGKQLFKLYATMEKGSLKAERQGEIDGISNKINLTVSTPGLTSTALAMLMLANQSWIFYVKTGSQMFRLGNNSYAAKMAPDGEAGTGDTTASAKGNTMTFFSYEEGFAGEVVDIAAIENMLIGVDENAELYFTPANGATNVLVSANINLIGSTHLKNSNNEDLGATGLEAITTLNKIDIDGNILEEIPFAGTWVFGSVDYGLNPLSDLDSGSIYEVKIDKTKFFTHQFKAFAGPFKIRFITA